MNKDMVKFIRNVLGLTQKEFSNRLGYSKVYITFVEKGIKPVTQRFENKLKQGFNITEEDMMLYQTMYQKKEGNLEGIEDELNS